MSRVNGISHYDVFRLFEHNVAGIYETTSNGKLLNFNTAFADFMGYAEDDLFSINGLDLYVDEQDRRDFISKINEFGTVRNREVRYRRKDGSIAWCIENAFLADHDGEQTIIGTLTDITDQKINAKRFQSLFYASADAVFILENGKIIQSNKRCCDLFGFSEAELQGNDVFSPLSGLFRLSETEYQAIDRSLCGNFDELRRISTLSQRKDGSLFHSELTLTRFEADDCTQHQLIVRDISERVMHEDELRESESRFKLLSDVAIEGIVFVVDDLIRDCNPQFVNLFGFTKIEELLGKKVSEFIAPSDIERVKQQLEAHTFTRTEIRTETKNGDVLFLEVAGNRIEYRHEEVVALLFYNITKRKKTEQALEQSTERFKSLVEHSPNGIFILTESRVKYVNQSGLLLLQHEDEDDIYDDQFFDFFHADDQKLLREELTRVREGEEVEQREYRLITSTGQKVVVGLVATLTVYDGKPSIQVTLNNLNTQMKLMQETLRAQLAEEINVVLKKEIEEHKNTQKKLREAENYTRNIIQSSLDMICAMNDEGTITEFNLAAQKQFGFTPKQIVGLTGRMLFADEKDFERVQEGIAKTGSFTGEIQNITRKGKTFTSFLSASVIRNEEGNAVGSMGVSRDITELKKAEHELRESEERYRDLFENATDFIFSIDPKGTFIYANRSFLETMSYTENELAALSLIDVVAGLKTVDDVLEIFAGKTLELEFRTKTGRKVSVFGDSSIKSNELGPSSIRAIYRDITELRKHEEAATEQAAKLESVFNSTENLMMWTMNLHGQLTSFNNNFLRWMENDFGYHPVVGDEIIELMGRQVNAKGYQGQPGMFDQVFTGRPRQFELPLLSKNNEELWFQVFVNPVRVRERMEEVSCLAYDITDRKEIDRRILASLKEKEVLLQEVHHRVKNNLQVISSILNLQSSFVSDEKVLAVLKESQHRIKTMSYIHEKLYQTADFSSIEFTEYIGSLARNLVQSYAPGDTSIEFVPEFDDIFLELDQAIPCGLIINELVSNALKYAYAGSDHGKLVIALTEHEGKVTIKVEDNGVGLPEGFQYENSESLGIYLVYALVEQLDAEIKVESEPGKGTRFLITFDKQVHTP